MSDKVNPEPNADSDRGRGDSAQSLREFIENTPHDLAWVREQAASGVCPGCGGPSESGSGVCFPGVTSMWCGRKRHHITRPTSPVRGTDE